MQASNKCLIPLVINTDGRVVRTLQDSEKFIKDLPKDDTPRRRTNEVIKQPAISNPAALHSTIEALRSTTGALRSTTGASCSTMGALRPNQTASHFNNAAPSSNREALRSCQYTNQAIHEDLPPSSPPSSPPQEAPHSHHPTNRVFDDLPPSSPSTPSSQFLSPPPISRSSTPVPTSDYSHVRSHSRYKPSRNGALQHQHAYDDVMPTYHSDICKRTRPHYESAQETEDLERETVEERHHVRVHDNSHIHSGRAQSQIVSTSHSCLPSHSSVVPPSRAGSSVVPTSCAGSLQRRHYPTGTQEPEEKSIGSMDVDSNFLFDFDGDVIMEIHQPDDELEAHMDVDADFVPRKSIVIAQEAGKLEWCMDVDADIVAHESMVIAETADELEWSMDVDVDIVMHESMIIAQVDLSTSPDV
ncbi:hypothetical protein BDR03DRAFT_987239 [Suillus americanus]|nr:hypothetical protein BDR03DRAFT_987239 [Suillus americanus]